MTACPPEVDCHELNSQLKHMLSHHHKYRDYEQMVDSLMARKESGCSEGSTIGDLQTQVNEDFAQYMGGEQLSPLPGPNDS